MCVCVCVLPRNLGEHFVSLLVDPIAGKNVTCTLIIIFFNAIKLHPFILIQTV